MDQNMKNDNNITLFSSFIFLKLEKSFRHLESNVKLAHNQECEKAVSAVEEELFFRTYSLSGLKDNSEILIWLISPKLDNIQKAWEKISSAGTGKYLEPTKVLTGAYALEKNLTLDKCGLPTGFFGQYKYLLINPITLKEEWHKLSKNEQNSIFEKRRQILSKYPGTIEHIFNSQGLDNQDYVFIMEGRETNSIVYSAQELKSHQVTSFTYADAPVFLCIGKDFRDILYAI
jgi:chlorite dismutase